MKPMQGKDHRSVGTLRQQVAGKLPTGLRGSVVLQSARFQTRDFQNRQQYVSIVFKPLGFWYFVMTAPGNSLSRSWENILSNVLSFHSFLGLAALCAGSSQGHDQEQGRCLSREVSEVYVWDRPLPQARAWVPT